MLGTKNAAANIVNAGFLAFDDGVFSKHRGMLVDIDFDSLLGFV
jgi:hypothetical protein